MAEYKAACAKITAAEKAAAGQCAFEMAIAEARAADRRLEEYAERIILAEGPMHGPLFAAGFCFLHHCFVVDDVDAD